MRVFLLGATGNLGCRILPALFTHGHSVVAYVRSSNKLESLLPASVYQQITVVQGDATNSSAVKKAILESECEAVINTAGVAAMAPWGKSDLPVVFRSVLEAVREAGIERGKSLRAWFLGGTGVLYFPGTTSMMSSWQNIQLLRSLPPNTVDWSMLCPMTMTAESSDFSVPARSSQGKLVASGETPPLWNDSWVKHIPLIGGTLWVALNAGRYTTTLEQNADFIANDLESLDSRWIGMPVGIIDPSK